MQAVKISPCDTCNIQYNLHTVVYIGDIKYDLRYKITWLNW